MKNILAIIGVALCLFACSHRKNHDSMDAETAKSIMQDISQRNLAYQPLTAKDDTLMQQVVDFYKTNGTNNELMEAYYLWGSVYRDLHDAPKAMEAFLNGINVADTTSKDCRYDILVRLYGQKNELLYKQKLFKQAAEEIPVMSVLSLKAKDTLYTIDSQWARLELCYKADELKEVADECWELLEWSQKLGQYQHATTQLNTSVLANLELGRIDDAQRLMTIYEQESGKVDSKTMISTFPIYYYTKGRLLLAQHKPDSAEIFFQRELKEKDWNNRQAAYRGLREVYEQKGRMDSISKYAVLQCEAVDSDYQEKLSENLQSLQQLYDYSRAQEDSYQKELQLQKEQREKQRMWWGIAVTLMAVAFLFYFLYTRHEKKIAEAELELEKANTELAEKEAEVTRLYEEMSHMEGEQQEEEIVQKVKEAEEAAEAQRREVQKNQKILDELRKKAHLHAKNLRQQYANSPIFKNLLESVNREEIAQPEDFEQIQQLLQKKDVNLMLRIHSLPYAVTEMELKTILLLRIGLTQTEVGVLTAHGKTAVSNILNRLYEKVNQRKPVNSGESLNWISQI